MNSEKTGASTDALRELAARGFPAKTVAAGRIPELQEHIDLFVRQGLLNPDLQRTYLRFKYNPDEAIKDAKTIFIIAMPSPLLRATFCFKGKAHRVDIPPTYVVKDEEATVKDTLTAVLKIAGHEVARARLPLKTLAVSGGLAQYGRNNVTYVPGLGSFHRLAAYYSDAPCDVDSWTDRSVMKACEKCAACMESCPTRAILPDRFLIQADRCLTWLNEREEPFPSWLEPQWHNAIIGCMHCQLACPVDKPHFLKVVDGPTFSEEETDLILSGISSDKLPEPTRAKLPNLGYGSPGWDVLLARNLRVLIDRAE